MGAEIVLLVFLVFYTIEELIEIATLGKQYFKGFFNNTDYTVLILGYTILGHRCFSKLVVGKKGFTVLFRALLYFYIEPSLKDVTIISDTFVDFTTIGFWSYLLDSVTGCCAFLAWIRIFKYVSFNKVVIALSALQDLCICAQILDLCI